LQNYFNFFSLVFVVTSLCYEIEKEYDILFVTNSFISDPQLFRFALNQQKIFLLRIPKKKPSE
jgi:hypothetical protein